MTGKGWAVAALAALACTSLNARAQSDRGSIPPSSKRMVSALDGKLMVPEGLVVTLFADSVRGARFMAIGPDGSVYVSQPRAGAIGGRGRGAGAAPSGPQYFGGEVMRLIDRDGDGRADEREVIVKGVEGAHGLDLIRRKIRIIHI